jgi:hypothetical protein
VKKRAATVLAGNTPSTSFGTGSNQIRVFNVTDWGYMTAVGNVTIGDSSGSTDAFYLYVGAGTSISGTTAQLLEYRQAADVVIIASADF